jgi:hypothetical protein
MPAGTAAVMAPPGDQDPRRCAIGPGDAEIAAIDLRDGRACGRLPADRGEDPMMRPGILPAVERT